MNLSTRQLAQLLIGVAKAQQAMVDAMEGARRGFKGTYLAPALDAAAKIRATGRPLTLNELPSRVLLQCQGRSGPDLDLLVRDLESVLNDDAASASEDDSNDLDMTKGV